MIIKMAEEGDLGGMTLNSHTFPHTVVPKDEVVWIDGCGKTAECWLTRTTLSPKGGVVKIAGAG
jgi:hypothetical protein